MFDLNLAASPKPTASQPPAVIGCFLNDGCRIVDQLLAGMDASRDGAAFDAALDLRWLLATSDDADQLLETFFRLRDLVEETHYLACYRLRRWLESRIVARVWPDRHRPAVEVPVRLSGTGIEAVRRRCLAMAFAEGEPKPWARLTFFLAPSLSPALARP